MGFLHNPLILSTSNKIPVAIPKKTKPLGGSKLQQKWRNPMTLGNTHHHETPVNLLKGGGETHPLGNDDHIFDPWKKENLRIDIFRKIC